MRLIKKIIRFLQRIVFIPILILFNIVLFCLYYFFFGHHTAIQYLSTISKNSLIPILEIFGATIGSNCDINSGITFHNCKDFKNLTIGDNCHIGKNCFFDLRDKITIENNVVISMQCSFITHLDMTKSELSKIFPAQKGIILIKKNTYIGANSTILMGVEIGQNSFVAAKSLVNKSVEESVMVAGIPAKKIKSIE